MTEPFAVFDCSLARLPIGRSCSNLRELLEAIRTVPDMVIEHHMTRCALADHFDLYEFPNDLARWCWDMLGDHMLAEQLGLIDPYQHESIDSLRAELVNVIEERVWEIDRVPSCPPGLELHLVGSRLIAYDTGERFSDADGVGRGDTALFARGRSSITCTLLDGGRRAIRMTFPIGSRPTVPIAGLVARLRKIDAQFMNLNQVRDQIIDAFRECLPVPQPLLKARPRRTRREPCNFWIATKKSSDITRSNGCATWHHDWQGGGSCTSTPRASAEGSPRFWAGWSL